MSRSDWIFFFTIGLILALGLVFAALLKDKQHPGSGKYGTTEIHSEAQQITPEQLAELISRRRQAQYADRHASSEDERSERDLVAQEEMAKWARYLFWTSLIGVVLLAGTLYETNRTAIAAQEAVAAARESADVARRAMVADKRAWLVINSVKLVAPTSFSEDLIDVVLRVEIENIGSTPAKSVWVRAVHLALEENQDGAFKRAERRFTQELRFNPPQLGSVVVPAQTFYNGERWPIVGDDIRGVSLTLFIGVTYRVVGDDAAHITYRAYAMPRLAPGVDLDGQQFVELHPLPFLSGEID